MKAIQTMLANRLGATLLGVILLPGSPVVPANATGVTAQTPDELVRQLYKSDSAVITRGTTEDDKRVPKYFDKSLGDLILADHHADDSDQISFDPVADTNGNPDWTNLQIGAPKYTGDAATVLVTFTLKDLGFKKKITYSLHKTAQGWRISDLATNEWDLKQILKQNHPSGK